MKIVRNDFKLRRCILQIIDMLIVTIVNMFVCVVLFSRFHYISPRDAFLHSIVMMVCVYSVRLIVGVYKGVWRYANATAYLTLILADAAGGLLFYLAERLIVQHYFPEQYLPVSYMMLAVMCSLLATVGIRLIYQIFRTDFLRLIGKHEPAPGEYHTAGAESGFGMRLPKADGSGAHAQKINIVIIGAGRKGAMLVDALRSGRSSKYNPYCFVDRDSQKVGNTLRGLRIYPAGDETIELIRRMPVQEIIIAIDDLTPERKTELFNTYEKTGFKVRIYDYPLEGPSFLDGKPRIRDMRIEDQLFRDSVSFNEEHVRAYYHGKDILVTGAGGSIGAELCRQIGKLEPKKLVLLDVYENGVYDLKQELVRLYDHTFEIQIEIASVRDAEKVDRLMAKHRPDIVFHAAAHKHVPLMEDCCDEAVKNNVHGTLNVVNAAEKYGVSKFIQISTDKAVNPTNVMGASKRVCEMIVQSRADSKTDFVAVRFGNVLGSSGSVIPLFMRQIENGGPVTVTDKRVVRYFMTIPEAAQLVMQAGIAAAKSEIYVLDMGKPMKILTLAENMIRFAGLRPYEDIPIVEIGLRPGEKLYEELLMKEESLSKTENEKIFIERDGAVTRDELAEKLAVLDAALLTGDDGAVRRALMQVVPTYHDAESVNRQAMDAAEMQEAVGGAR